MKLTIAFVFFAIGTAALIDWIIFSEKNKQITSQKTFVDKYFARFPIFLERLFTAGFPWHPVLLMILFSIAGLIFVSQRKRAYMGLGIVSFVFAFWNLFSLM